ncbi:MAG: hypothetical protein EOM20_12985 [Spartobacteria bacterium]|nr:hypothetical protein [Spartobacteria bacterium]
MGDKKSSKKKKIAELVAIDLASSGMKLIRARKGKEGPVITAVDVLPPVPLLSADEAAGVEEGVAPVRKLPLTKQWIVYYAAIAVTGESAAIRYVSLPGNVVSGPGLVSQLSEHMGLDGEYRIAHVVTSIPDKKVETRILAAALPVAEVELLLSYVDTGYPAALSLEISSLASLNAFLSSSLVREHEDGAIAFIDSGARVSLMAVFNKGSLVLVRKFNVGGDALIKRLQQQMAVDRDVAAGILADGSFDISQSVHGVMEPFLRQISISKEFVERREDCRIKAVYVTGGMSLSQYWMEKIQQTAGVETLQWNPFAEMEVGEGALPDNLAGQEPRFSAAVGSLIGAFEES